MGRSHCLRASGSLCADRVNGIFLPETPPWRWCRQRGDGRCQWRKAAADLPKILLILDNNVHYGDEDGVSDDSFDEVINEEENFDDVSTEDMLEEYPETSEEYSEENYE